MSGAAGLSAARRRRAGSSMQSQNQVVNNATQQARPKRISVQSILENHELRLREVEPRLRELIANNNIISESSVSGVDESLVEGVNNNGAEIAALRDSVSKLTQSLSDIQMTVLRLTNKVAELASSGVQTADITSEVVADSGNDGDVAEQENEAGSADNTEVSEEQ